MKYETNKNGNVLMIMVEGRLDTTTAPELEKELNNLEGIDQVIFDFEKLEYISSSGLRMILKFKKAKDDTKVINCSAEVYEVFTMTGFAEMMTVERALRKISIESSEKIGEGFFGIIYRLDPETIVKVYKMPDSLETIKREKELAKRAFVLGIPTAIAYDIVKVGDLYGAVFELLNTKSLVGVVNNPNELESFTQKSADILKNMHQKEIEKGVLPSRKEELIHRLKDCESVFETETYEKLLALLETIPETNTLLHCDFHIKNIMMQEDELLLIDMDTLSTGHPIFEFGSMFATYYAFSCVDEKNTDNFLGISLEVSHQIFDQTFANYYADKTPEEQASIRLKLSVISYLQVLHLRLKFTEDSYPYRKDEMEFCKKYLTNLANQLETLNY